MTKTEIVVVLFVLVLYSFVDLVEKRGWPGSKK